MRRAYAVAVAVVVGLLFVAAVLLNVAYTQHEQQQADHRWCALFETLDPPGEPPTTDRGRVVQQLIRNLRNDFHCQEAK